MVPEQTVVGGIVKNGVVVPEGDITLCEGARVNILLPKVAQAPEITPELQAEFDLCEQASDEDFAAFEAQPQEE